MTLCSIVNPVCNLSGRYINSRSWVSVDSLIWPKDSRPGWLPNIRCIPADDSQLRSQVWPSQFTTVARLGLAGDLPGPGNAYQELTTTITTSVMPMRANSAATQHAEDS